MLFKIIAVLYGGAFVSSASVGILCLQNYSGLGSVPAGVLQAWATVLLLSGVLVGLSGLLITFIAVAGICLSRSYYELEGLQWVNRDLYAPFARQMVCESRLKHAVTIVQLFAYAANCAMYIWAVGVAGVGLWTLDKVQPKTWASHLSKAGWAWLLSLLFFGLLKVPLAVLTRVGAARTNQIFINNPQAIPAHHRHLHQDLAIRE